MKKILCIKTHAIGDLLMATPALRELHTSMPQAEMYVLTGRWSAPVLKNNPHITGVIEYDDTIFFKNQFFKIASLILKIRKMKFDTAIIFHTSPFIHFFALLAGIKTRIGMRRNKRGWFLTRWIDEIADADYYYPKNFLKLLETTGIFQTDYSLEIYYSKKEIDTVVHLLNQHNIRQTDSIIVLAAGGAKNPKETIASRLWPKEHYAVLIEKIHGAFPAMKLVLVGAENDAAINRFLSCKNIPALIDLTGKTTINDLAFLADRATAIVCNDSSMLHIGVAMKKPVVCFFGPTAMKSRVPPEMAACSIQSMEKCSPCYTFALFPGCTNSYRCMATISPDSAFDMIKSIMLKK